jgi:hypothetical protein
LQSLQGGTVPVGVGVGVPVGPAARAGTAIAITKIAAMATPINHLILLDILFSSFILVKSYFLT